MRTALRDDDAANRGPAIQAWLTFASIDLVQNLKIAFPAFRIDVVRNGRAFVRDRKLKHIPNRLVQPGGAFRAKARRKRAGMNSREE